MDHKKNKIIFTPGPLEISQKVREAFLNTNLIHRDADFERLLAAVQKKLLRAFGVSKKYFPCIFTSTGRGSNEAMIIPYVLNRVPLFVSNGSWGDNLIEIAKYHKKTVSTLCLSRHMKINPQQIDSYLKNNKKIDTLYVVHQETRSGILNPLPEIAKITRKNKVTLIVDAMSSAVVENTNFEKLGVAMFSTSSAKGLRSIPGLGIVCGEKTEFEKMEKWSTDSHYFNLYAEYAAQHGEGKIRFAQSVPLIHALNTALDELFDEGIAIRRKTIFTRTENFRTWAEKTGLTLSYPRKELGHAVTTCDIPHNQLYKTFSKNLSKSKIFLLYGDTIKGKQFQVSFLGAISEPQIKNLKKTLTKTLNLKDHFS